jgi:hypothetical protein
MSRQVFVLEEVIAMLQAIGAAKGTIENFRKQAEFVASKRPRREYDEVEGGSGFGQSSQRGHVELVLNDQLTQMDVKKAREIGLMLLEAAEAATSDEMFIKMLDEIGISDPNARGNMLVKLREIRQGTRGVSWPS